MKLIPLSAALSAVLMAAPAAAQCESPVAASPAVSLLETSLTGEAVALVKAEQRRALQKQWLSALREQRSQLTAAWLNSNPAGGPTPTAKAAR